MSQDSPEVIVRENGGGLFQQEVLIGRHRLVADEPVIVGGADAGPAPYEFLMAGLGACTSMTLRMYAERRNLPLKRVSVGISHEKVEIPGQPGKVDRFLRTITVEGDLDEELRGKLLEIANKCPVHRTLSGQILIDTEFDEAGRTLALD